MPFLQQPGNFRVRTLSPGIQEHKEYLHWALKPTNITYMGVFGSLARMMDGCQNGVVSGAFPDMRSRTLLFGPALGFRVQGLGSKVLGL